MKFICILTTLLCIAFQGNAGHTELTSVHDKIYVNAEDVYINNESISVQLDDLILPVKSLYVDQEGIYIKRVENNRSDYWTCGICGSSNQDGKTRCWYCGELKEWGLNLN